MQAMAAQAHWHLTLLQQAAGAAQHSRHSAASSPYASKQTSPRQPPGPWSRHAYPAEALTPKRQAPEHTPPQARDPPLGEFRWGKAPQPMTTLLGKGNASGLERHTYQQCRQGSVPPVRSNGGSPVRLTAGHWQYNPAINGTPDAQRAERAQREYACSGSPGQGLLLTGVERQLWSAESEVARLRALVQKEQTAPVRKGTEDIQVSGTAWARKRENDPYLEKGLQESGWAMRAEAHAELASVSAQVAQQRSALQQLKSQVMQVAPLVFPSFEPDGLIECLGMTFMIVRHKIFRIFNHVCSNAQGAVAGISIPVSQGTELHALIVNLKCG